jgi:hypothetical protein
MSILFSLAYPQYSRFEESERYNYLGELAGIGFLFTPLEIKALYVIGLLEDIFTSVSCLLQREDAWSRRFLPAFGLFSSSMDLFGRCLSGNISHRQENNLEIGFHYLLKPVIELPNIKLLEKGKNKVMLQTNHRGYTINDLMDLRNYSLHGQATVRNNLPPFDIELLDKMPERMGHAMEIYWNCLQKNNEYCERLAHSRISVYRDRFEPLLSIIKHFQEGKTISDLFSNMDWQIYKKS